MRDNPVIIGLTGSIGMGKSATAKMFMRANIPVFDSDKAVHDLMARGGRAMAKVEQAFTGVSGPDGIDRKALGAKVFGDATALKRLENILHPLVSEDRQDFYQQAKDQGHDMVLVDIPLLFETGAEKSCDYTLVVTAPKEVQRDRVLARPNMTEQKFADILARQMPDMEKRERADFVIQTDRGFDYAEQQVQEIIEKIRADKK